MEKLEEIIESQMRIDKLVQEQTAKHSDEDPILDGILSVKHYLEAQERILYIAKEPNSPNDGGWDFKNQNKPFGNSNFWYPLKYITYGILHPETTWKQIPTVDVEEVNTILNSVAYINISKIPAGASTDMQKLKAMFSENKEILEHQIAIIHPTVTVCLGTFDIVKEILLTEPFVKLNKHYKNAYISNGNIILDCYHVGATYGGRVINWEDYCVDAIEAFRSCKKRYRETQ